MIDTMDISISKDGDALLFVSSNELDDAARIWIALSPGIVKLHDGDKCVGKITVQDHQMKAILRAGEVSLLNQSEDGEQFLFRDVAYRIDNR